MLESIKNLVNNAVAEGTEMDMSQASAGGERYLLPEGNALARMVEYIEVGKQPQNFQGQEKAPAMEIRIGFALYGEGYQKEDGSPRMISSYSMKLSNNEKSKTFKMFNKMNAKKTAKSFAQLLGEPFIVPVKHRSNGKQTYATIDTDNIMPAIDPVSRRPYDVPQPDDKYYRVFLWNHPTKETWDSLYIEGKNFIQEQCLSATDFQGSKLDQMLNGKMPSLTAGSDYNDDEEVPF